ncbi:MAG: universal stress protein [Chloroflexi bacterium]|nr:universal stress protein [Chloroflexota bacterium]
MFKRFLVPLDGSKLAESVLPTARFFAECFGATMLLFHVVEQDARTTVHGERHLANAAEAEAYLDEVAARLAHPAVAIEKHVHAVRQADVAASIIEHATEYAIDLIVLCAHGNSGWRDRITGNIAQQVVARGTTPVLFARENKLRQQFACAKILIPLDGTAIHEPALPVATDIARACGAGLHLLTVVPTTSTLSAERSGIGTFLPTTMTAMLDLAQRGAVEYLQALAAHLLADGIPTTANVARGDVAPAILSAMERTHADLIVLATHGRGNLDAFWSGSVTPKVLSRSSVPVLLVRVTGEEVAR